MNNSTKLRIRGSRKLFESIAQEILAEAKGGKSHAQKLTEKMMGKKKKEKMEEAPKEKEEVKKLQEFNDFGDEDDDFETDDVFVGSEVGTEEDLKSDLIKAGFSEMEAAKTAAQLVKIGKTKK
jgi:hypothetical protein